MSLEQVLNVEKKLLDRASEEVRQFAAKINRSGWLCGWETTQDNLKTNPAKYA